MEQKERRSPGRPRGFETAAVVEAAQALFWREGFADTSLDALAEATGLHKPSLYAAFGGKRGLYLAALDAYFAQSGMAIGAALANPDIHEALAAYFAAAIALFTNESRGCFSIATAMEAGISDPEVAERGRQAMARLRGGVHARLERGVRDGQLSATARLEPIADAIVATHIALGVQARSGIERGALEAQVGRFLAMIATLFGGQ